MNDYISVVYNTNDRPLTSYPDKLTSYLCSRFSIKKSSKLLDVGCGRGDFLHGFHKLGLDVTGFDKSPNRQDILGIKVVIAELASDILPFEDNTFDVVFSKSFIEHLNNPEWYIAEANRILKPNGLLITMVPDWESCFKIYFDDHTHKTPFTVATLTQLYKMEGLKEVDVSLFRQLPIVWKYPLINRLCSVIAPFIPIRTQHHFFRWAKELMVLGVARKNVQ